jgi:alpha-glucosidase
LRWCTADGPVLDFVRPHAGMALRCVVNLGNDPVVLPPGEMLVASRPLDAGRLPVDAAVWLRMSDVDGDDACVSLDR